MTAFWALPGCVMRYNSARVGLLTHVASTPGPPGTQHRAGHTADTEVIFAGWVYGSVRGSQGTLCILDEGSTLSLGKSFSATHRTRLQGWDFKRN